MRCGRAFSLRSRSHRMWGPPIRLVSHLMKPHLLEVRRNGCSGSSAQHTIRPWWWWWWWRLQPQDNNNLALLADIRKSAAFWNNFMITAWPYYMWLCGLLVTQAFGCFKRRQETARTWRRPRNTHIVHCRSGELLTRDGRDTIMNCLNFAGCSKFSSLCIKQWMYHNTLYTIF